MKALDILSTRKVTETYKADLRFAIHKDFFSALGTFNPPFQKLASGYRLFLKSGEQVDVPESFQVEVYEAASFKGKF